MDSGKCWRYRATVVWHHGWSMQWNVDFLLFECMFSHENIHKNSVKHSVIYICAFFLFPASYIEIVQKTFIPESLSFGLSPSFVHCTVASVVYCTMSRVQTKSVCECLAPSLNCCWIEYFKLASSKQNWSSVAVSHILHSLHICLLSVVARLCQQSGSVF
jgi:hypothetical protein